MVLKDSKIVRQESNLKDKKGIVLKKDCINIIYIPADFVNTVSIY